MKRPREMTAKARAAKGARIRDVVRFRGHSALSAEQARWYDEWKGKGATAKLPTQANGQSAPRERSGDEWESDFRAGGMGAPLEETQEPPAPPAPEDFADIPNVPPPAPDAGAPPPTDGAQPPPMDEPIAGEAPPAQPSADDISGAQQLAAGIGLLVVAGYNAGVELYGAELAAFMPGAAAVIGDPRTVVVVSTFVAAAAERLCMKYGLGVQMPDEVIVAGAIGLSVAALVRKYLPPPETRIPPEAAERAAPVSDERARVRNAKNANGAASSPATDPMDGVRAAEGVRGWPGQ